MYLSRPRINNANDSSASIGFALPRACEVELALYDIKGRKVATLAEGTHQPGEYSATANGLSSGVYIYEMNADEFSDCKKMVVR
ncbi:MAG: T9SS type A sorting domain-containing protein [bacterium]|nr:T9SS type A sorting domain-containing protein [bacterium]